MTSSETLRHLGYDDNGNCAHLLTETDRKKIEEGQYERVGGDALCPVCKMPYRMHPKVQGALWLNRACPNLLIKL